MFAKHNFKSVNRLGDLPNGTYLPESSIFTDSNLPPTYATLTLLVGVNYLDRSATTILAGGSGE